MLWVVRSPLLGVLFNVLITAYFLLKGQKKGKNATGEKHPIQYILYKNYSLYKSESVISYSYVKMNFQSLFSFNSS